MLNSTVSSLQKTFGICTNLPDGSQKGKIISMACIWKCQVWNYVVQLVERVMLLPASGADPRMVRIGTGPPFDR